MRDSSGHPRMLSFENYIPTRSDLPRELVEVFPLTHRLISEDLVRTNLSPEDCRVDYYNSILLDGTVHIAADFHIDGGFEVQRGLQRKHSSLYIVTNTWPTEFYKGLVRIKKVLSLVITKVREVLVLSQLKMIKTR